MFCWISGDSRRMAQHEHLESGGISKHQEPVQESIYAATLPVVVVVIVKKEGLGYVTCTTRVAEVLLRATPCPFPPGASLAPASRRNPSMPFGTAQASTSSLPMLCSGPLAFGEPFACSVEVRANKRRRCFGNEEQVKASRG